MKFSITTVFILIFTIQLCFSQGEKNVENEAVQFEINWIESPVYTSDTSYLEDQAAIIEYWETEITNETHPNWLYSISRVTYPADYIHSDSSLTVIEELINSTQSALLEEGEYELLSSFEIELNDYFGKEFRWKNIENEDYFIIQVFIIENCIFELSVYSREGSSHNKASDRFFSSFQISNELRGNYQEKPELYVPGYSINFPMMPKQMTRVVDSDLGKLNLYFQLHEPEDDLFNALYMSSEVTYPTNFIDEKDEYQLNTFYINSINGSLNSANGQLITIHDIQQENIPGKEFKMYLSDGSMILRNRILYKNGTLYNIGVMTTSGKDDNLPMRDFLDSFRIKEK